MFIVLLLLAIATCEPKQSNPPIQVGNLSRSLRDRHCTYYRSSTLREPVLPLSARVSSHYAGLTPLRKRLLASTLFRIRETSIVSPAKPPDYPQATPSMLARRRVDVPHRPRMQVNVPCRTQEAPWAWPPAWWDGRSVSRPTPTARQTVARSGLTGCHTHTSRNTSGPPLPTGCTLEVPSRQLESSLVHAEV